MEAIGLPESPSIMEEYIARIPKAQGQLILNAGFAENLGGWVRSLDREGKWQWEKVEMADGEKEPEARIGAEPPSVIGSGWPMASFLPIFIADLKAYYGVTCGWTLNGNLVQAANQKEPVHIFTARIGTADRVIGQGTSNEPGIALAIAMLNAIGFDPLVLHQELFPGEHILAAANGGRIN
jgi:hypothetical protein